MMYSDQIDQIAAALAKAQGEMKAATKDAANPHLRSKYATLAAIVDAIREPLSKHGLSVVQPIMETDTGPVLVTMLLHESGQWISSELKIRTGDGNRGITQVQALGSAITYTRRYALSAMLSIPVEDDDGQSAAQQSEQNPQQHDRPKTVQNPQQLLAVVNNHVLVPYENVNSLFNAIRQESTFDDYHWPKPEDIDGWRRAYELAKAHAVVKTTEQVES